MQLPKWIQKSVIYCASIITGNECCETKKLTQHKTNSITQQIAKLKSYPLDIYNTTDSELRHGVKLIKCTMVMRLCGVLGQRPAPGWVEEVLCLALTLTCSVTSPLCLVLVTTKSFKEKTDAINLLKPGTKSCKAIRQYWCQFSWQCRWLERCGIVLHLGEFFSSYSNSMCEAFVIAHCDS